MTKLCPKGHENPDDANWCQKCKYKFEVTQIARSTNPEEQGLTITGRKTDVQILNEKGNLITDRRPEFLSPKLEQYKQRWKLVEQELRQDEFLWPVLSRFVSDWKRHQEAKEMMDSLREIEKDLNIELQRIEAEEIAEHGRVQLRLARAQIELKMALEIFKEMLKDIGATMEQVTDDKQIRGEMARTFIETFVLDRLEEIIRGIRPDNVVP